MNRFEIMPCIKQSQIEDSEYEGMLLPLVSEANNSSVLFFPLDKETAKLINYIKDPENSPSLGEIKSLDVYRTMLETWTVSDHFLSGVFMDMGYDNELNEDSLVVNFILSSLDGGYVDAVVKVNFIQAIITAILEDIEIMVGDEVLARLLPPEDETQAVESVDDLIGGSFVDEKDYPHDKNIYNIVKQIMNGKIK